MKARNLRWMAKWLRRGPRVVREESAEGAAPGLGIAVSLDGDHVRVALVGELDLGSAVALERKLEEVEARSPATIELDLRRLDFMDSTGISLLFRANRRAREDGRRVVLLKGEGPIDRILELARVEDAIDTVAEPSRS